MSFRPPRPMTAETRRATRIITLAAFAFTWMWFPAPANSEPSIPVDLELVIALDVSTSMDREERQLQRDGFVAAFRDPEIVRAILSGQQRRIAVLFIEWAGEKRQDVILDWRLVSDTTSALSLAEALEGRVPGRLPLGTSIGDALLYAASLFGSDRYAGTRQVIDFSGDGTNNRGPDPAGVRDALIARGITINGLPIVYKPLMAGVTGTDPQHFDPGFLIRYFQHEVIGGPASFVEPVLGLHHFPAAIRRKLMREIRSTNELAAVRTPSGIRRPPETASHPGIRAPARARAASGTTPIRVRQQSGPEQAQVAVGAFIAATTWPTAARLRASEPPR